MHNALSIDPALLDHATPRQREVLQAVIDTGSGREAARQLGVDAAYPGAVLKAVKKKAALQGYSPDHDMTRTVPEGFKVRGVSTYYDRDGLARGQWVKSSADDQARVPKTHLFYYAGVSIPTVLSREATSDRYSDIGVTHQWHPKNAPAACHAN